jgi:putative DNA primase/helicase
MTPLQRVQVALEAAGCRRNGRAWLCPAHDDSTPSLSLAEGQDGRPLLNCHAGCAYAAILAALKLDPADLRPDQRADEEWTPSGPAVATYTYHDAKGRVVHGKCRTADKRFSQWRPDPAQRSGRAWSLKGVTTVLYRLPAVLEAIERGERVYVCEGEKDADAVTAAGGVATTNTEGAGPGKWKQRYSKTLADAVVVIIADDDESGRTRGREIAASLAEEGCHATLTRPAAGKDAYDHLDDCF